MSAHVVLHLQVQTAKLQFLVHQGHVKTELPVQTRSISWITLVHVAHHLQVKIAMSIFRVRPDHVKIAECAQMM